MKTLLVVLGFFPLFASAAVDFPVGKFECLRQGPGAFYDRKAYEITKVPMGAAFLPYIEFENQTTESDGHVYPTVKQAGLATITVGGGIVTLRMERGGLSFNDKGEPQLTYCKRVVPTP